MVEDVGDAGSDAELHVAELDADFLHGSSSSEVEDTEVGDLEPLLSVVAIGLLECIEKIDTDFWWLGFEFEEGGSGETAALGGDVVGEAHDTFSASGEDADVVAEKVRHADDELADLSLLFGVHLESRSVEGENGAGEEAVDFFFTDEESVVVLVGVDVEVVERGDVPVDGEAHLVVGFEVAVRLVGEEELLHGGCLAEDEVLKLEATDVCEDFYVFGETRKVVEHEGVGLLVSFAQGVAHGAVAEVTVSGYAGDLVFDGVFGADEDALVVRLRALATERNIGGSFESLEVLLGLIV